MRLGSCSGTKCVPASSTYRLCGVCALAARIRSADVIESHVLHDVYGLWPRLRCPVLLVRASRPTAPGGGLVVSRVDAERFATEARDVRVVDVDTDHYSILISPPAISAVERFVGAGTA
jgi:hypothetical protein